MKIKCKRIVIILILGIFIAVVGIINYNIFNDQDRTLEIQDDNKFKSLKKSAVYSESFIHIDGSIPGNWSNTAITYDWCSGDGSWSNPYIIENVIINASSSPTGNGILINNSKNDCFIIRDCVVYNTSFGYDSPAGIRLQNTNNGTVVNNNCSNNRHFGIYVKGSNYTFSENIANENGQVGIFIRGNNNIVSENIANENGNETYFIGGGMYVYGSNNTVSENIANGNVVHGFGLNGNNNLISENIATDNNLGIEINGINNLVLGNNVNNNDYQGILLIDANNLLSENIATDNNYGIDIGGSTNNTISGNIVINNSRGIYMSESYNNTISGNIVSSNLFGIFLSSFECNYNTITRNFVYENSEVGIATSLGTKDNSIFYNSISNNLVENARDEGLNYWDNGIVGNYWSDYSGNDTNIDGIGDTPYDIPGGSRKDYKPLLNIRPYFLKIPEDISYELGTSINLKWTVVDLTLSQFITYNIFVDGVLYESGFSLYYISYIEISIDLNFGTHVFTIEVDDGYGDTVMDVVWVTVINTKPVFTETSIDFSYEVGSMGNTLSWTFSDESTENPTYILTRDGVPIITNNPCASDVPIEIPVDGLKVGSHVFTIEIDDGYGGTIVSSVWVTVINTKPVFTETPNDLSYEVGKIGNNLSWTFSDESTNNPTYTVTRNGLSIISNNPCISDIPIEISIDGLEVNSHVFTIGINDGYGETIQDSVWVTVLPSSDSTLTNLQYVELIDHSFSIDEFNITFSVFNENGQAIDLTTIQVWWNGIGVSDNVISFGNGLYFVSLEPVTVTPGEDPILLKMIISASGYEDKLFETYLAVDPEMLEKNGGKGAEGIPLVTILIVIISTAAGIAVATAAAVLLRKGKRASEVI